MHDPRTLFIGLIAALSLATSPDAAAETPARDKPEPGAGADTSQEKEIAASAIREAADEAALSVANEARLDLDIRLIGPTSPTIAGRK